MRNKILQSNFKVSGNELKDINEGVEYVFTLKDKNVLEDNNEDDLDEIENALMKEFNKKKKKGGNDLMEDYNEKKDVLPQYGEEKETGFIIRSHEQEHEHENENEEEGDTITSDQKEELSKIREKFKMMKEQKNIPVRNTCNFNIQVKKTPVELKYEKKFVSDYMTQEEFKAKEFKKKKTNNIKKSIRSIQTIDSEEKEQFNTTSTNAPSQSKNQVYDEYDELNFYLEKQRNMINKDKPVLIEAKIKEITRKEITHIEEDKDKDKDNQAEYISETTEFLKKVPTKKDLEENMKMIISTTTRISLKDLKSGNESVVNIPLPTDRLKYGASSVMSNISNYNEEKEFLGKKRKITDVLLPEAEVELIEAGVEGVQSVQGVEGVEEGESLDIIDEPLVGKGIATALQVLKKRGLIGQKEMWGRFKDKAYTTNDSLLKKEETVKKQVEYDIDLDYRDKKGRVLTPKEMYRQQSYIFHGKGPGKKKIEKKLLRDQLQEKMSNLDPTKSSKTFQYLKNMQRKTNTAFVVLQGKNSSLN